MKNFSLPVGWRYVSLLDLVDVIGGVAYNPNDITNKGIRIVRGGNIQDNIVKLKDDDVYLPLSYKNENNSLYRGDIVLVASTGSVEALGRTATVWEDMKDVQIGAFLRILRPKQKQYSAFISAWLSSEHYLKYIKQVAKGTSINNIGQTHLQGFKIPIPLESEIDSISHVYSSLSNKIALNRAINRNLEALAKQLYDYWFVQFDFPDENGRPYKSSGGKMVWNEHLKRYIPNSFSVENLTTMGVYNSDYTANGSFASLAENVKYNEGEQYAMLVRVVDFNDDFSKKENFVFVNKHGYDFLKTCHLYGDEIIICNVGNAGATFRCPPLNMNMALGPNGIVVNDKALNHYLFMYYSSDIGQQQIKGISSGSIQLKFNKTNFRNMPLLMPPFQLINNFNSIFSVIYQHRKTLWLENRELIKQRDELLPLLMNGQVTIE